MSDQQSDTVRNQQVVTMKNQQLINLLTYTDGAFSVLRKEAATVIEAQDRLIEAMRLEIRRMGLKINELKESLENIEEKQATRDQRY